MKKITFNLLLFTTCILFANKVSAQDGYTYTLIDNGSFSYTIGAVPNTSSNNFVTSVQSYGFTIILPDGITANITSSLGNAADATFFNGDDVGDSSIDGYLITETLGSPSNLTAPSTGTTNNMVTIQLNGNPTSGSIYILENNSSLANAVTPLKSFMSADMIDDSMAVFPNVVDANASGVSGTSSYNFMTLSVEENELTGLNVFPNPATNIVNIQSTNASLTNIEVFNTNGQLVLKQKNNLETMNVSNLQSGIYFVKIYAENAQKTVKLLKQ